MNVTQKGTHYTQDSTGLRRWFLLLSFSLFTCLHIWCQTAENTVKTLVEMGYENVSWTEDDAERVYILQNTAYRLQGKGIGKAVDLIQQEGLSESKPCRIIVLDNNVPQISLYYRPIQGDTVPEAHRQDWQVSYELGTTWKKAKRAQAQNSSLFKVDIVVYPDFYYRNIKISRVYDIVLQISPAIEISLWKGMKLSAQIKFPIINDYGYEYEKIRPGFITLSQTFRLPQRTFLTATAGFYNNNRWGLDVKAKHYLKDEHFWVDARLGMTFAGQFDGFDFHYGTKAFISGNVGVNYYWTRYNTQFRLKAERYLLGEYGVRFDVIRNFRYASIGLYAMKIEKRRAIANKGFNGGFRFQIALPPYKYKRKGYIPRVLPTTSFGLSYNAGNEFYYGKNYDASARENIFTDNEYNPYFIKSELLNY
jgi:hypothetical protein